MTLLREGLVLGVGNPLLDITVVGNHDLLKKYNLEKDNAIIGDDSHLPLYKEITDKFSPSYTAGGSAQNSVRVCQWILKKPKVCAFMGSVGEDEYSNILKEKALEGGVDVRYQHQQHVSTGTCAVIVTQNESSHRSLVANLAAANCFTKDHLLKPENTQIIENAEHIYIGGFFLTVCPEAIMMLAESSHSQKKKTLMTNLSAPFICQHFSEPLLKLLPYVDILFGNSAEAQALSSTLNFGTDDVRRIGVKITQLPRKDPGRPLVVIITQGADPVLLFRGEEITEIAVPYVPEEKVVDTNGAGDAFVGGFLSQFILGKPLEDCVVCANWAATHVIQQSGCVFDPNLSYNP